MKILVMDDDPTIRDILARIFQKMGHKVDSFSKGEEINRFDFDLYVLDLENSLGMGGIETMKKILQHGVTVNIVLMSGNHFALADAEAKWGVRVLPKPFSMTDVTRL